MDVKGMLSMETSSLCYALSGTLYFGGRAYQLAELRSLLLCDPRCQGDGSHSSGLGDGNDPLPPDAPLVQVLGDLSGLPRAGLPWRVSSHNIVYGSEACVPVDGTQPTNSKF